MNTTIAKNIFRAQLATLERTSSCSAVLAAARAWEATASCLTPAELDGVEELPEWERYQFVVGNAANGDCLTNGGE